MSREAIVLTTLVVYKLALLAIGVIAERRTKDQADFLLGGRSLGPLVAAISASASSSSVWTLLGVSGYAFAFGMRGLWLLPACIGGFLINWCFVAPRLRRLATERGALTLTEVLAGRDLGAAYRPARIVASVIVLLSLTAYVAYQFQGAGKTFEANFATGATASIVIGAVVVVVYTVLGGFWAVSLTDTLQGLMMAGASVILPIGALWAVGGFSGLSEGLERLGQVQPESLSLTYGVEGLAAWGPILVLLAIAIGYPGQPHVVTRFMAMGDENSVRKARIYSLTWAAIVYPGMILVGLCGRILLAGDGVSGEFFGDYDRDTVFFDVTNQTMPAVVAGVLTAAVLSAIMSTADSQLLAAAGSVSHDLDDSGRAESKILRSRLVVVGLSVLAVLFAIYAGQGIFDGVLVVFTALGAAFGPLLVVTLWRGKVGPGWTLVAMLAGFGLSVVFNNIADTRGTWIERVVPYIVATVLALGGASGSARRT